jgi:hypothetical protein
LKSSLNVTDVKYKETHENAAWCYGYLEGTIKTIIKELEDASGADVDVPCFTPQFVTEKYLKLDPADI